MSRPPKTELNPDHKKVARIDSERKLSGKKRLTDEQMRRHLEREGWSVTQQMVSKIRNDDHYFLERLAAALDQSDEIRNQQIARFVEELNICYRNRGTNNQNE
jgi:hypothetical protein